MICVPGAALIAKELEINCMKWDIKQNNGIIMAGKKPFIYSLREANVRILVSLSESEQNKILDGKKSLPQISNIGLQEGDCIDGKLLLLSSDLPISKPRVGDSKVVSGRHKRQYLRVKSDSGSFAFIISSWAEENIEPPEPWKYLIKLNSLIYKE